jgi:hypothetical protein
MTPTAAPDAKAARERMLDAERLVYGTDDENGGAP